MFAVRREGDGAGHIAHNLPRRPTEGRHTIEIEVVAIYGVGMGVVEVIAIGCKGGTSPIETDLRWDDCHFAPSGNLFDPPATFSFASAISHQSAVGGDAGKIGDLSMFCERANVEIASIDDGWRTLAHSVEAKCSCKCKRNNPQHRRCQNTLVPAGHGHQHGTG